ncbi:MAG: DUF1573 domain-containing protein [Armatimonadota bacterium]
MRRNTNTFSHNRPVPLALPLVFLVLVITAGDCAETDALCGPKSLAVVCRSLGLEASLEEIAQLCGYDEKAGTTLLGLQNAAKGKGLQAVGVKIGVEELAALKVPAIAHLWGSHFVVVEAGEADNVKVTNPPDEPILVKKEDFKKVYSGFALLFAKDTSLFPTPKPEGPDLRFDAYAWDFGTVNQGDQSEHVFKCRNAGNEDLVISKVETSCGDCLVPMGGPQTIPVGGSAEIRTLLTTANQRRGVAKELLVTSNDPISPVVHLAVAGYVRPARLLLLPGSVNFGNPRRTESAMAEVYVPSFEEDKIEVTSVSSNSPHVTVEVAPSKHKERPGCVVTAALRPGAPLGELKAAITIVSNHWKQPKVEVPVTATIRGSIDLDRESFFLGLVKKGNQKKCAVTISTVSKDLLKIEKVESSLDCVSVEVAPKSGGADSEIATQNGCVLTATLKPDAPLGNIKGEVTIHTNDPDQPIIKVPVYAYVE